MPPYVTIVINVTTFDILQGGIKNIFLFAAGKDSKNSHPGGAPETKLHFPWPNDGTSWYMIICYQWMSKSDINI